MAEENVLDKPVDFAISYAGEDGPHAEQLFQALTELGFEVFLARAWRTKLTGVDAERFLEDLFLGARQVVVFVSRHYREKPWPRFEWDVILERGHENRFIPVRLDDTRLYGLPNNIIYHDLRTESFDLLVMTCVDKLLAHDKLVGFSRPGIFEQVLAALQHESRGATARAYQLIRDQRQRSPLADIVIPPLPTGASFDVLEREWRNFSVVRRLCLKIAVPDGLSRTALVDTAKHCVAVEFNRFKPDAVSVLAYRKSTAVDEGIDRAFDATLVEFAPEGEWGKAMDGVAYNLPSSAFDYSVTISSTYPLEDPK